MLRSDWTTSVQLSTSSVTLNTSGMCPSTPTLESEGPASSLYSWRLHTHWLREAQLPAGKCWHPRGPRPIPRAHTRLTQSTSCPQRNKGDFMSLFKSFGFGYISAPPYMDLLRTDLSLLLRHRAQIRPWAFSEQHSILLMWEMGTGWLNMRHHKITVIALDGVQACAKHRSKHCKYTLWSISDQIFRVIWLTRPKPSNLLHVDKFWINVQISHGPQKLRQRSCALYI